MLKNVVVVSSNRTALNFHGQLSSQLLMLTLDDSSFIHSWLTPWTNTPPTVNIGYRAKKCIPWLSEELGNSMRQRDMMHRQVRS